MRIENLELKEKVRTIGEEGRKNEERLAKMEEYIELKKELERREKK